MDVDPRNAYDPIEGPSCLYLSDLLEDRQAKSLWRVLEMVYQKVDGSDNADLIAKRGSFRFMVDRDASSVVPSAIVLRVEGGVRTSDPILIWLHAELMPWSGRALFSDIADRPESYVDEWTRRGLSEGLEDWLLIDRSYELWRGYAQYRSARPYACKPDIVEVLLAARSGADFRLCNFPPVWREIGPALLGYVLREQASTIDECSLEVLLADWLGVGVVVSTLVRSEALDDQSVARLGELSASLGAGITLGRKVTYASGWIIELCPDSHDALQQLVEQGWVSESRHPTEWINRLIHFLIPVHCDFEVRVGAVEMRTDQLNHELGRCVLGAMVLGGGYLAGQREHA